MEVDKLEAKLKELENSLGTYTQLFHGTRKERRLAGFTKKELGHMTSHTKDEIIITYQSLKKLYQAELVFTQLAAQKAKQILEDVLVPPKCPSDLHSRISSTERPLAAHFFAHNFPIL